MVSHYHYLRKTKRAQDNEAVKNYSAKTYGYDFGNDGYRNVVPYNKLKHWVESKVGQRYDDVWKEVCERYDSRNYVGQQCRDYISYLLEQSRWSDYYLEEGVIKKREKRKFSRPAKKVSFVYHSGRTYHRHNNIWYEVVVKTPAKKQDGTYYLDDVFLGLITGHPWWAEKALRDEYGIIAFCVSKKQVGKRLCKKLNILKAYNR